MSIAQNDQGANSSSGWPIWNGTTPCPNTRMLLEEAWTRWHVLDLCREAMDIVGKRSRRANISARTGAGHGEMLDNVGAIAKPLIAGRGRRRVPSWQVLIGTVHGDLHDIGKNIVTFMPRHQRLRGEGHRRDVPVQTIDEIGAYQPDVVGLSGFLTPGLRPMKENHRRDRRRRPAQQHEDRDRRRPDRRNRAFLHWGRCLGVNAVKPMGLCRNWMGWRRERA